MSVCVWTLRIFLILDCVKRNVWRVVVKWYNLCCRPSTTMSPLERLNSMSPAAQRLASKRLGVRTHTDSALRASYSPSPSRTPGDKTPVHLSPLPSGSSRSHAGMPASGPSPLRQSPRTTTPKPSLTDNLLKVPHGLPVMVLLKHTLKYLDCSSCLAKCLHTNLCTFTFTLPPLLFTQEFRWHCLFLVFCLTNFSFEYFLWTFKFSSTFTTLSGRRRTVVHIMMIVMTEDCESFSIVK